MTNSLIICEEKANSVMTWLVGVLRKRRNKLSSMPNWLIESYAGKGGPKGIVSGNRTVHVEDLSSLSL